MSMLTLLPHRCRSRCRRPRSNVRVRCLKSIIHCRMVHMQKPHTGCYSSIHPTKRCVLCSVYVCVCLCSPSRRACYSQFMCLAASTRLHDKLPTMSSWTLTLSVCLFFWLVVGGGVCGVLGANEQCFYGGRRIRTTRTCRWLVSSGCR